MRISDWSSDVCSSDLADGEGLLGIDLQHLLPDARAFALVGGVHPGIVEIIQFLVGRHVDRLAGQAMRSEEHTSELQSLMRISYAGFFLTNNINSLNISDITA